MMSNETIHEIILAMNNGSLEGQVFSRPLSGSVVVAKYWPDKPNEDQSVLFNFQSETIFLIKNEKEYVGMVLDMRDDLHWYILPNYRKMGYLTRSLSSAIIPYLFKSRDSQRITISEDEIGRENYSNSRRVAELLGFQSTNSFKTEYQLNIDSFDRKHEDWNECNLPIEPKRIDYLNRQLFFAHKLIAMVSDELLMSIGDDGGLYDMALEVKYYATHRVEDIYWNVNRLENNGKGHP